MRVSARILVMAFLGTSAALADTPVSPSAPTSTTPVAPTVPVVVTAQPTAPAAPTEAQEPVAHAPVAAAPAAATTASTPTYDDKHFVAEGYRIEKHGDTKLYCRREEVLGTRLGAHTTCSTAEQLRAIELQAHDSLSYSQRMGQTGPGPHQ